MLISPVAAACVYGPNIDTFSPALGPRGTTAWLHVAGDSLRAEVLAVEGAALLVLVDEAPPHRLAGRLARVPFTAIGRGELAHASGVPYNVFEYAFMFWFSIACAIGGCEDLDSRWDKQPGTRVGDGASFAADSELLHRLRLLSRYPQGVDDQLLARLETTYGETAALEPGGDP